MWDEISESLHRIWRMLDKGADDRRREKARARFWAEVREGQQEADVEVRPEEKDAKDIMRQIGMESSAN
jgi:hypothetical protein